jgi:hypothetical protein
MYPYVQLGVHETVFVLGSCQRIVFHALACACPYLSSSVNDFREEGLAFVDDLMAERILDGGIVAFDKMAFAVLDS